MNQSVSVILKGFAIGAANVVPGVSGGTIALLTGIFSRIVNSISSFAEVSNWKLLFSKRDVRSWWKAIDGTFLFQLFIGLALSIFSLAKLVTWALKEYPVVTWAFFFSLVIVSTVYMFLEIKGFKVKDILWVIIGIGLGIAFCLLTPTNTPNTAWFYFVSGAIAICTMILPGVSGSFVLQIFGNYDIVMEALTTLNMSVLLPFGLGALIGIIAFSKLLKWLLARYEKPTLLLLLGFVLGSIMRVWPWYDMEIVNEAGHGLQIFEALCAMVIGGALVVLMQMLSKKHES